MPLEKDPSGRRSVSVEVEVPGTPEQVWAAIATGPGISSWFVPTTMEHDADGKPVRMVLSFGPGMDSIATVTAWDPPKSFRAESTALGPQAPPVATEWIVEARDGGRCVVRVVHSLFASEDTWDDELEAREHGWPSFFRLLRLYLTHFPGQSGAAFQVMGSAPEPKEAVWATWMSALGITGARLGGRVETTSGVPPLGGRVEHMGGPDWPEEMLLVLDRPAPGIAHLFAMPMGGMVLLSLRLFLFGPQAATVVARDARQWTASMSARFPMAAMGETP